MHFLEPAQISKPFPPAPIDRSKLFEPSSEYAIRDAVLAVFFSQDHRFCLTGVFREGIEHAMGRLNYRPKSLAIGRIRSILIHVRILDSCS